MKVKSSLMIMVSLLVLSLNGEGKADEIWLKNGDHLTGQVIRMENNLLTLKTSYAGELSVKWEEVAKIRTD